MAWVEKKQTAKGIKYVGRYRGPDGKKRKSPPMDTRKAAKDWGEDHEAAMRRGDWVDPAKGRVTFREWCHEWWELYDYRKTTESGYYSILNRHLLPEWGDTPLRGIEPLAVEAWVRKLRKTPKPNGELYSEYHVQSIRRLLFTILEDAVAYDYLPANPARKRRRGTRTDPAPVKREIHTSPLGALLFAERAAVLAGRDDEFLAAVMFAYTGLRWAELVGLERKYIHLRKGVLFVEWELVEVNGKFHKSRPKTHASIREVALPGFLVDLITTWLNRDDRTHLYMARGGGHPYGSHVGDSVWRPAADGWYPDRRNRHGNPVGGRPVLVDTSAGFPGVPHRPAWPAAEEHLEYTVPRGPGIKRFPDGGRPASWLPISMGLSPHDLRRSMRTWLQDGGIPMTAAEKRMGHEVPGVDAVYNVVTEGQRQMVLECLEGRWWDALAARRELSPTSPVPLLQGWLDLAASRIDSGKLQWGSCPPFAPQERLLEAPGGR